jgi:hypothetical protein
MSGLERFISGRWDAPGLKVIVDAFAHRGEKMAADKMKRVRQTDKFWEKYGREPDPNSDDDSERSLGEWRERMQKTHIKKRSHEDS